MLIWLHLGPSCTQHVHSPLCCYHPTPPAPHLLPQVIKDGLVLAVVSEIRTTLLHGLLDLNLQLVVGLLQVPHCLQVVGQTVIQALHCHLLVAHDISAVATGAHLEAAGEAPCSGAHSHASFHPTA